ncbi:polysaccharide export protein [bacterium]|nr:polysaccharide export protein [bacterium]
MKRVTNPPLLLLFVLLLSGGQRLGAQIIDDDQALRKKQSSMPKAINFYELLDENRITREEFDYWKRKRMQKLEERLTEMEALEGAIDPDIYLVGPGDVFYFNIWGGSEDRYPLTVSPEGTLYIPSAGEIPVTGLTLNEVKQRVLSAVEPDYEGSRITLSLAVVRIFRVHVTGEVNFPATYTANAVDRVSEMITQAGGVTERAWKGGIQIRHRDGTMDRFDLAAFERDGLLDNNIHVTGGDIVYVPSVGLGAGLITVEADQEFSGTYRIAGGEDLLAFLQRIRALKRNTDLSKLVVVREGETGKLENYKPYAPSEAGKADFILTSGDRVILPSQYVYVKGAVRQAGAYPYVFNLTAKEYAGMAGGDYRSASITSVSVYHARTGITEKGADVLVEPGDIVHLNLAWHQRVGDYLGILYTMASLFLAAKAAGLLGKN